MASGVGSPLLKGADAPGARPLGLEGELRMMSNLSPLRKPIMFSWDGCYHRHVGPGLAMKPQEVTESKGLLRSFGVCELKKVCMFLKQELTKVISVHSAAVPAVRSVRGAAQAGSCEDRAPLCPSQHVLNVAHSSMPDLCCFHSIPFTYSFCLEERSFKVKSRPQRSGWEFRAAFSRARALPSPQGPVPQRVPGEGGSAGGSQGSEPCLELLLLPRASCQGGEYALSMPHAHSLSLLSVKATAYPALLSAFVMATPRAISLEEIHDVSWERCSATSEKGRWFSSLLLFLLKRLVLLAELWTVGNENIFSPVNSTEGGWNLYFKEGKEELISSFLPLKLQTVIIWNIWRSRSSMDEIIFQHRTDLFTQQLSIICCAYQRPTILDMTVQNAYLRAGDTHRATLRPQRSSHGSGAMRGALVLRVHQSFHSVVTPNCSFRLSRPAKRG
ncbi:hypothetical protein DV515_00009753 [Chloebia gouldiae]|uniref:Uncharacterized protein n=1 Tax=Chloebia gouldiae TaxID=44316 RepID=A0A3L8SCF4_CHLGU|nr:hypothetical protein DV515_00009753 [Chloebia gouldiae]